MDQARALGGGIRARALLGTIVSIRLEDASTAAMESCINAGFAAAERVHRLMSFHEPESDVSRLNRFGAAATVQVDPLTFRVLKCAIDISNRSGGCFDITVAPQLVERGLLPLPKFHEPPDPEATWQDIELLDDHCVRFRRPLWLDLGGIAKGFAVDHVLEMMALPLESSVCINAGGDLRVAGPGVAQVRLRNGSTGSVPVMRLQEASLASSSGRDLGGSRRESHRGPHIHGIGRMPMGRHTFVSVVARECMVADALTKVVMALKEQSEAILVEYGATAYQETNARGWRMLGAGP